jgi:carbon storage regulator
MLVLSRRPGEAIVIGSNIRIMVIGLQGDRVKLGITAPENVRVDRAEVAERRVASGTPFPPVSGQQP